MALYPSLFRGPTFSGGVVVVVAGVGKEEDGKRSFGMKPSHLP